MGVSFPTNGQALGFRREFQTQFESQMITSLKKDCVLIDQEINT